MDERVKIEVAEKRHALRSYREKMELLRRSL